MGIKQQQQQIEKKSLYIISQCVCKEGVFRLFIKEICLEKNVESLKRE